MLAYKLKVPKLKGFVEVYKHNKKEKLEPWLLELFNTFLKKEGHVPLDTFSDFDNYLVAVHDNNIIGFTRYSENSIDFVLIQEKNHMCILGRKLALFLLF
jgi:hypothetical protein|tara:strand:+ start:1307 stop:1606 length:300 start_codon:yes stop_codon:yes gene_type:complete